MWGTMLEEMKASSFFFLNFEAKKIHFFIYERVSKIYTSKVERQMEIKEIENIL